MEEREWSEYTRGVLEAVKWCEERNERPVVWAMEVGKWATAVPSPELGQALVAHLCFDHNRPSLWKFLEQSLASGLLFPLHVLSLLSARVIPNRRSQPKAFRLYLELIGRYALSFEPLPKDVSKEKIVKSVDDALQLSQTFGVCTLELGHIFVLFLFCVINGLIDSMLDDCGLQRTSLDRSSLAFGSTDMDVDSKKSHNLGKQELFEEFRCKNSLMAMEVLGKLTESKKTTLLLRLVHINMPEKFNGLVHRLQLLGTHWLASPDLKSKAYILAQVSTRVQGVMGFKHELGKRHLIGVLIDNASCKPKYRNFESAHSASWVPLDIYMENVMDGKQLPLKAIDVLAEVTITLHVLNQATWQETFLALWLSALRLVQRDRDPVEGPIPHLEARLSVLLCIVPLAIAKVLEDEALLCSSSLPINSRSRYETSYGQGMNGDAHCPRKHGLISSLQVLGQFSGLLCAPALVADAANIAATKAAQFVHNSRNENNGVDSDIHGQGSVKTGGDMRHLIVEACIARNLINTSAYFWPDYVSAPTFSSSEPTPVQKSPWLTFMEGAPLSDSLIKSLVSTHAPSLAEIEKLYNIALDGSDEEKSAAAKILCGASLKSGWNIQGNDLVAQTLWYQEHVVRFVVKLLCPPVPPNYSGSKSHLVDYMSMLSAILYRASSIDTVHILSLHGMAPEVASCLVPLCEVFGSLEPTLHKKSSKGDEHSVYMVFSLAFLFLLRLWKFYRPLLERCITEHARAVGNELNLDYLLLLHNRRNAFVQDETNNNPDENESVFDKAVYIDSYPKLKSWYFQNISCVSSTLCSLSTESPVHQIANKILNMINLKMTKSGSALDNFSMSSNSGSPTSNGEDLSQRPMVPAWQVLEAIPFVLEALLTACAHGRLSSRNLTTGLRDLIDFLPASLAAIISYFSAEVTRGIWKSVPMNGRDWPSPAPLLRSVESEVKEILAAVGVSMPSCIPSCTSEVSQIMLPLPMAVLVSLTITFKLDKSLEYIHAVAGPALENCASGSPWPGMPIIGSLWAQKVRRWHDFIVVSCSRSVFRQDKEAVAQLLGSCFASFLGPINVADPSLSGQGSVNGLLGFRISACTAPPCVAPGFLYLRSCQTIQNVLYVTDMIVKLVAEYAQAVRWSSMGPSRLKSSQASVCLATAKLREVATLGSSLLCVTGGYRVVQELYMETLPTWLLTPRELKQGEVSYVSHVVEGYAMAYLAIISGAIMWGVKAKPPKWVLTKRVRIVGVHMDFLARVLEGKILMGCHPATWKAYISCLVGLMLKFAPTWIPDVKIKTLKTLASGLRGWHEPELALSLLERGGVEAMGSAGELVNIMS